MSWGDLAVVMVLVVLWASVAVRADRAGITAPMVFALAGVALAGDRALHITLSSGSIKLTAELTLVLVLFTDAARIRISSLRQDIGLPLRLLGIGLPLTVLLGALAAHLFFGQPGIWMVVLISACLAPTDASLGSGIVTNESVPSRVRRALNVESGLNDGIVAPLVSLAVAVLAGQAGEHGGPIALALREILIGADIGVGAGCVAGWLLAYAVGKGWTSGGAAAVAMAAAAIGTYALAEAASGNGFVGAFIGGLCFGAFQGHLDRDVPEVAVGTGQLLACLVWFAFGAAMLRPALSSPDLARAAGYAVVSLTLVRMVPVAVALLGARLGWATVAFMGWFGPRGLASVVFALLASDELGHSASTLLTVVSVTVALSIVCHGVSANPLIRRYVSHISTREPGHPLLVTVDVPPARRPLGAGMTARDARPT